MSHFTADYLSSIAIIGGGLGGTALALALTSSPSPLLSGSQITIYESRPLSAPPALPPSGVLLTPNGLQILDTLGVLARIQDKCFVSSERVVHDREGRTVSRTRLDAPGGWTSHRVWRAILLEEMRLLLRERGVKVEFGARFEGVVGEGDRDGVRFLVSGEEKSAGMLVGSDGIYSSVRKHLSAVEPSYTGLVGLLGHVERAAIRWPSAEFGANGTIQDVPGAILWIAEDPAQREILVGQQIRHPEQKKGDLEVLQQDKEKLMQMFVGDYESWGEVGRMIIDALEGEKESLFLWPFMKMPKIERWFSETGRVVLVGDGAHAIPPSSGQGVNQGLEDVYSLTVLLKELQSRSDVDGAGKSVKKLLLEALAFWQDMRQERIDVINEFTINTSNTERMSAAERAKLKEEGKLKEDGRLEYDPWLYKANIEERTSAWFKEQQ